MFFPDVTALEYPQMPPTTHPLIEGLDYYKEGDKWVFTADYLKQRGVCCSQGCRHCPFRDPQPETK
jgi:hypothetical protein